MSSYVGLPDASSKVISNDGWYLNLGDVGFFLIADDLTTGSSSSSSSGSGSRDYYWQSRESQMLIKGGANYSFEQVIY
jgi:hypothetical protein